MLGGRVAGRRSLRRVVFAALGAGGLVLAWAAPAVAVNATVATVDWAGDFTFNGTGTGTLGLGTVTYTTANGFGVRSTTNWNTSLGTDDVLPGGGAPTFGANLGALITSTTTNTVEFTHEIVDPMVLIAHGEALVSLNFGANPAVLLDSNNAVQAGNVVGFTATANNTVNDAFAVRVSGTFGPGNPLVFDLINANGGIGYETVTMTLAAPRPEATDITALTPFGTPVTVDPVAASAPAPGTTLDLTTVRLVDPANGNALVTTLTTADGTYTVNGTNGEVTFTPASGFTGTGVPVGYQLADSNGIPATATITVTVSPEVGVPLANPWAVGGVVLVAGAGAVVFTRRRRVAV